MTDTITKHTGTCKFFGDKGASWGFISPDDGSRDVFVHISAVSLAGIRELTPGMRVEFTLELDERSKRPCATNLRLI
jgi:CspA family cold shock protein